MNDIVKIGVLFVYFFLVKSFTIDDHKCMNVIYDGDSNKEIV